MCCYTNFDKPEVVDFDIHCWKVIEIKFGFLAVTPFVNRIIPSWVLNGKRPFKARGKEKSIVTQSGNKYVGQGFVHAWTTREKADAEVATSYKRKYAVKECVIKAGTPHYISTSWDKICAKELLFVNENDSNTEH